METKIIESKQYNISWRDVLRSCIFSAVTGGLTALQQALDSGIFNWKSIAMATVGGFVAKLLINFAQKDKLVIIPSSDVNLKDIAQVVDIGGSQPPVSKDEK